MDGRNVISGQLKAVKNDLGDVDKETAKWTKTLNSLRNVERGSVASLKQQVNALKQAISETKRGTANYKLLENALKATRLEYNKAAGIQKGSVAALKQQIAEVERLANSYTIGSREQRRFQRQLDVLNGKLRGSAGGFTQFANALEGLGRLQSGFLAISTIIQGITGSLNQFIGQAKQVEGFELALKNIGLSGAKTNKALREAAEIANELGAPIQQVEKSFKRMLPALKAVGVSSKNSTKFIEAISARTQTLGLNTEQSGRYLEAFAQVLSKGKLQAEELNQQISELDGSFRTQLADALNVTTSQLEDMISAGEITAEKFVKAVSRMSNGVEELRERIASGNYTVQQLQNLVNNLNVANLRQIGQVLQPAIKAFFDIGRLFQEFIRSLTQTNFGQFILESINGVVIGLRNFANILFETTKAIVFLLDPVFALVRGINSLLSPFGGLIGILTTYVATLVAVTTAQRALNAAAMLSKATWTGLPQLIELNSKALKGLANAIRSVRIAEMIPNLKNFGSALRGNRKQLKKAGSAAGKTKAQYDDLQTMFNQMVPSLATSTVGTKALSAAASVGAAKIGLIGAAVALILAPLAVFVNNLANGEKEINRLDPALKGLKDTIKEFGGEADESANGVQQFFGGIGKGFANAGRNISRFFGSEKNLIDGSKIAYISYERNIMKAQNAISKFGIQLSSNKSIQQSSNEALSKAIKIQQEVVDGTEEVIESTKERIKQAEREGDMDFAKSLKEQLKELLRALPTQEVYLKNLKKEEIRRKDVARATGKNINSLKDLNEQLEISAIFLERSNLEKQAEDYEKYGKSADQAYQLQAANIMRTMMLRNSEIGRLQYQIDTIERLRKEGKIQESESLGGQRQVEQAKNAIIAKTLEQKQAEQQLKDVVINSFEARLQKSSELAQAYDEIAGSIAGAAASARSALSSTFQSISSLIDNVFDREIQGLQKGSLERRKLVAYQLQAQLNISRLETQIAKVKNDVATRVAISELRTSQQRLRNEAAIARLKGDDEGAKALEAQADATGDIIKLKQVENRLNNRSLEIQQRLKEDKILQRGIEENIAGFYTNKEVAERRTAEQLGVQKTSYRDIARYSRATRQDMQDIQKFSKGIDDNLNKSDQTRNEAPGKAANEATKLAPAILSADKNAKVFLKTMDDIYTTTSDLNKELAKTQEILSKGTSARWMGGPVEGGQTYRVNDAGLGREAFMNKFGNISLLPAGSNINWTAPSSGTIIPAAIVKQMQRNADTNQNLSQIRRKDTATVSNNAGDAMAGNSGNLVKQMTAALSGSGGNQRITNNVTIQSQQPVTDASQIMTNVARMRLRNARRI